MTVIVKTTVASPSPSTVINSLPENLSVIQELFFQTVYDAEWRSFLSDGIAAKCPRWVESSSDGVWYWELLYEEYWIISLDARCHVDNKSQHGYFHVLDFIADNWQPYLGPPHLYEDQNVALFAKFCETNDPFVPLLPIFDVIEAAPQTDFVLVTSLLRGIELFCTTPQNP